MVVGRLLTVVLVAGAFAVFGLDAQASGDGNCAPQTTSASDITTTSATLNGLLGSTAIDNGSDADNCVDYQFEYGTSVEYGSMTTDVFGGSDFFGHDLQVSQGISGLAPGTTYHFQLYANGMPGGGDLTFTTLAPAPEPASLSISNSVSPASVQVGAQLTFSVVVANHVTSTGSGDADGVTVTDTLPAGLTPASATATTGDCSGTQTVTCTLATLANTASATVTIVALASAPGTGTDVATVSAFNLDPASQTTASAAFIVSAPAAPATIATTPTTTTQAPAPDVIVNESIGPVGIGMTEQDVEKLLGKPESTLSLTGGKLVRYHRHGRLFLVTFDTGGKVVSIESYSSTDTLAGGVGPGAPLPLAAALRGFRPDSCELGYWNGTAGTKPSTVVTVFTPDGGLVESVLVTVLRFYTACAAGSHESPPPLTVLDRSIGGVGIGMSQHDVIELLGSPSGTLKITLGGGKTGLSVRYRVHGSPLLVTYDSSGRVVSIEAYSSFFQTAGGIGPGSSLALVRALHGFRPDFCELGYWNGTAHTPPSHIVTVFTPQGGLVASVLITQLRLYTDCDTGSHELAPA